MLILLGWLGQQIIRALIAQAERSGDHILHDPPATVHFLESGAFIIRLVFLLICHGRSVAEARDLFLAGKKAAKKKAAAKK
jgi:hypothetical protein